MTSRISRLHSQHIKSTYLTDQILQWTNVLSLIISVILNPGGNERSIHNNLLKSVCNQYGQMQEVFWPKRSATAWRQVDQNFKALILKCRVKVHGKPWILCGIQIEVGHYDPNRAYGQRVRGQNIWKTFGHSSDSCTVPHCVEKLCGNTI